MQRTHRWLPFVVTACGIGCGGGDSAGPDDLVAGTYSLRTVNGSDLPFPIAQIGAVKVELTSDILTLTDAGTFTQITTFSSTTDWESTSRWESEAGSFTRNGSAVSFAFNSGTSRTGTISGGAITVTLSGVPFVYLK